MHDLFPSTIKDKTICNYCSSINKHFKFSPRRTTFKFLIFSSCKIQGNHILFFGKTQLRKNIRVLKTTIHLYYWLTINHIVFKYTCSCIYTCRVRIFIENKVLQRDGLAPLFSNLLDIPLKTVPGNLQFLVFVNQFQCYRNIFRT